MRYPASEKLEIIRLVEQSHLPANRTLEKLGIPKATFCRWYDLHQTGGPEALDDRSPRPDRVWNRIPDDVRERIRKLAPPRCQCGPEVLWDRSRRRHDHCDETSRYQRGLLIRDEPARV